MDIAALRKMYPFRPYQPAFYAGKIVQVISWPTPDHTIMIRKTPGDPTTMIEIPAGKLRNLLVALLGDVGIRTVQPDGLAILVERLGIDESPEIALLFVHVCIEAKAKANLSQSWGNIKHYLHDVQRRRNPDASREEILHYTIAQLCDAVSIFVRRYYGN